MRALGLLTAMFAAGAGVAAAVVGIRSIPDIKRYLKIRNM
ncbi:MAG: DUF6893 family small protein [Actinomycetes bacterium]